MEKLRIRCSKYNEVSLKDIEPYIVRANQIHRSRQRNGIPIGLVDVAEGWIKIYSDDEVDVFNVRFCLAAAPTEYFDEEIIINKTEDTCKE